MTLRVKTDEGHIVTLVHWKPMVDQINLLLLLQQYVPNQPITVETESARSTLPIYRLILERDLLRFLNPGEAAE